VAGEFCCKASFIIENEGPDGKETIMVLFRFLNFILMSTRDFSFKVIEDKFEQGQP